MLYTNVQEDTMRVKIDETSSCLGSSRRFAIAKSIPLFLSIFLCLSFASVVFADTLVCTDCHVPPHGDDCNPGCTGCHGNPPTLNTGGGPNGLVGSLATPTGSVSVGAHAKHATTSGMNYSCDTCHSGGMPTTPLIGNNKIQIGFNINGVGGGAYDGHALNSPYTYEETNGTTVTTGGAKTCSNIYCHSNGTSIATGAISNGSSPAWDATGTTCSSCHGYPPSYAQDQPKSNSHVFHVSSMSLTCNVCHFATTADGVTITNVANHANQVYNVTPDPDKIFGGTPVSFTYSYDPGGGRCSNISCHGPKDWGGVTLTAGVWWTAGPACFEVDFTGHLNGTPPQSFSWDFGDGQTGEGESITHLYPHAGGYAVQLSAADVNRHSASTVANVTAQKVNKLPVPDRTVTVSGYTVTVTDYSTDPDYNTCDRSGPGSVRVQWGASGVPDTEISVDLTDTRPAVGRSVSRTYSTSGTYVIRHAVRDNDPSAYIYSDNVSVTVPARYSVSGKVTRSNGTTPISGVLLYLKSSSKTFSASTKTDGTYTFTNVVPDTYYITASKAGYTFSNPAVTGVVVASGDVTGVNFRSITP